ncbi:hypothetical protein DK843_11465 [Chromobacterium phragmitis]|nr:hypothetical protein DK843_11465 [Chromobacterium phragmitis]
MGLSCLGMAQAAPQLRQTVAAHIVSLSPDGGSLLLAREEQLLGDDSQLAKALEKILLIGTRHQSSLPGLNWTRGEQHQALDGYDSILPAYLRWSDDGMTLALSAGKRDDLRAVLWRRGSPPLEVGPEDSALAGVLDLSRDGRSVLGWFVSKQSGKPRGFLWREGQGAAALPADFVPLRLQRAGKGVFGFLAGADGEWGESAWLSFGDGIARPLRCPADGKANPASEWLESADGGVVAITDKSRPPQPGCVYRLE